MERKLIPEVLLATDFDGTIADSTPDRERALLQAIEKDFYNGNVPTWVASKLRLLLDSGAPINPTVISEALGLDPVEDEMILKRLFEKFRHYYTHIPDEERRTFVYPDALEGYGQLLHLAEKVRTKLKITLVLLTNSEEVVASGNVRAALIPEMEAYGVSSVRDHFLLVPKPDSGALKHTPAFLEDQLLGPFVSQDHCYLLPVYYGDGQYDLRAADTMGQLTGVPFDMHIVHRSKGEVAEPVDWDSLSMSSEYPGIRQVSVVTTLAPLLTQFLDYFQKLELGVDIDEEVRAVLSEAGSIEDRRDM